MELAFPRPPGTLSPTLRPVAGWRRAALRLVAMVAFLLWLVAGYVAIGYLSGNVATIVPGEAYRAGQLGPAQIAALHREMGIASVINLRGRHQGSSWYDAERAAADRLGIAHYDFPMSARRELSPSDAEALIALMRTAPKPVLIHCEGGADRTGLAAALYVAAIAGGTAAEAEWHLSPIFGHAAVPGSPTWAMDASWERMEPILGIAGS